MTRAKHSVKVESIEEYNEAVEAAETLGLEAEITAFAQFGWLKPDGSEFHAVPSRVDIDAVESERYIRFDAGREGYHRARFAGEDELDRTAWIKVSIDHPTDD